MIPLSSQDIADVLSLDSKEVTKHLSEMREKNLIRMGRYIIISNLERLKEEAHS
jgi:CRP-like cAMP-binding protein